MLEVRHGVAAKSHENAFFRRFARSLKSFFDSHGLEGILLGFPLCKEEERLKIDALLLTDRTMMIIDFKDYEGVVDLPNEEDFEKGLWKMSDGVVVKGGSSSNPFRQLGLQRRRLGRLLTEKARGLTEFDPRHIVTIACFTGSVEVNGAIPGKYKLSFFIADSSTYLERIFDITSVEARCHDLLDDGFLELLNGTLFESAPYECQIVPDASEEACSNASASIAGGVMPQPTAEISKKLSDFMSGDDDVLIITGTVGSGKSDLAGAIREKAYSAGFVSARLFALSNRVRNNLLTSIEEVESLYASIYDLSKKEVDRATGVEVVPLARFDQEAAFADIDPAKVLGDPRTVFIVYESHMVTNDHRDDGTVRFGSGGLLDDLLEHLSIDGTSKGNKLVFVGDRFQLGFGSWARSSLNPLAYDERLSVSAIELPDDESPDGIQSTCLEIADHIRDGDYSELVISPNEMVDLKERDAELSLVSEVARDWTQSKIVAYSNKRSADLNAFIKRKVLKNGADLAVGDVVIFNNQIHAHPALFDQRGEVIAFEGGESVRVENGAFGVVQGVGGIVSKRSFSFDGLEEEVSLTLMRALVKLRTDITVEVNVLMEYLHSEKGGLSDLGEQAMQWLLRELLAEAEARHPFSEGDQDFDEMVRNDDYQLNKNGDYRDKEDGTKLTRYERRHRERVMHRLLSDPDSEYSKWLNAARIKYGWCITVHRSMSYTWPNVVFATGYDQGRNNEEYFKFLYTGISRATDHVSLVRWKSLSPFSDTAFVSEPTGSPRKRKAVIARIGDGKPSDVVAGLLASLGDPSIEVTSIDSKNHLEMAAIIHEGREAVIGFDYNKKGELFSPRLIKGDADILRVVSEGMGSKEVAMQGDSPLCSLYDTLNRSVLGDMSIEATELLQYEDRALLKGKGREAELRLTYDKRGLVSTCELMSGDQALFLEAVSQIGSYYA